MLETLILLVAAHCYGDFLWQAGENTKRKRSLRALGLHAAVHGVLAYLILQQWAWWPMALAVILAHGTIELVKNRFATTPSRFALEQAAHLFSLLGIAWIAHQIHEGSQGWETVVYAPWIILGAGFTATVWGVGHFIRIVADQMCDLNPQLKKELGSGLKKGGSMIGKLERALIFTLIAIGYPAGIGFLVAAKSILRFEEAKKQPLAEYVLIGTLWSYGLAIAITSASFSLLEL